MECAACTKRAVHAHHVVLKQTIEREKGDPDDPRATMPLCLSCHRAHHWGGKHRLELPLLADEHFDFARELLGPGKAFNHLRRHYRGTDPRLDSLISSERIAQPTHDG